jgi:hypothetical protein
VIHWRNRQDKHTGLEHPAAKSMVNWVVIQGQANLASTILDVYSMP